VTLNLGQQRMAKAMPERTLQESVRKIAKDLPTLLYYHVHRAQHSPAGFPDCVFLNKVTGAVVYAELKREGERPSPAQQEWIDALHLRHHVFLWKPTDLIDGTIARTLIELAGPEPEGLTTRR
jgi:hypothetical protein